MITDSEIQEIRHILKKSERPLFLYDDDPDGLTSYLLLRRYLGRGKGSIIKSSPKIDQEYVKKIEEVRPDVVFILDKPIITQEFVDAAGVPIVWIDHHAPVEIEGAKYYNPRKQDDKDNRPTSYWCYKITQQDRWLAACGIVGDWTIPDFINDLIKEYPELIGTHVKDPGEALYTTELGRLVRVLTFILKAPTGEINKCTSILLRIENPYEILNETTARGKFIYQHHQKAYKAYQKLLKTAESKVKKDKLLIFTYPSTKMSLSSELSNELLFLHPDKIILVGREKPEEVIISVRSAKLNLPKIMGKCLEGLEGHGGGHEHACGGKLSKRDFPTFMERFKKEVE